MKKCLLIFLLLNCKYAFSHSNDKLRMAGAGRKTTNTGIYSAKANDVIISEILADPNPQIGLPAGEFIELFNTTQTSIPLKNWTYTDGTVTYKFSNDSIAAGEYLILCPKADTSNFKNYGRVIGLTPWPSLNNTGDKLSLRDELGTLINQVNYTDQWYKDGTKKQGGWSLELIDPFATCSGIQNWVASNEESGGTPGKQNSVYKPGDKGQKFQLMNVQLIDSITLAVVFNRSTDSVSAAQVSNYMLNNGLGHPAAAFPSPPEFTRVNLKFAAPIARGNTYRLTVNNVSDCAGTIIAPDSNHAEFTLTKKMLKNDILINEILFNPRPDGVDFVEIINNSSNALDLKELSLASLTNDTLSNAKPISSSTLLIQPGQYMVLSTNPDNIRKEYFTENRDAFQKMNSMPAFNDDEGVVVLLSNNSRIDQLNYSEKMHFKLIKNPEGVSLERSGLNRPTNEPGNFQSAAASVGYATPGYKNSQYVEDNNSAESFSLASQTFSPDNDGFEDMLQINYHFEKPGLVANISIYNDRGMLIRKLSKNLTLASEGSLNWDGFNESAELSPTGIYLIYAELFDLDGRTRKYRKTCVLAKKLK